MATLPRLQALAAVEAVPAVAPAGPDAPAALVGVGPILLQPAGGGGSACLRTEEPLRILEFHKIFVRNIKA